MELVESTSCLPGYIPEQAFFMDANNFSPFNFWVPLDMEKSVDSDERRICGIVSTEDSDLDGEHIREELANYSPMIGQMGKNLSSALMDRIDWTRFDQRHGWIKWEHGSEPGSIIGIPERIEKGIQYRDPINNAMKSGTAIWGKLFGPEANIQKANEAWGLIQAIRKSGFKRNLGYSIEGAYLSTPNLPATEKGCLVTNAVLTTKPVNSWAWADLAKALVAGPGNTDSNLMEGGEALRKQSLFGSKLETHQGGGCEHLNENGEPKSEKAALEHLVKCKGSHPKVALKAVMRAYRIAA